MTETDLQLEGKPVEVRGRVTDVSRTRSSHVHLRLRQDAYGLVGYSFADKNTALL
jgi:hypothetical protein